MPRAPTIEKTLDLLIILIFKDPRLGAEALTTIVRLIMEIGTVIREEILKN